MNPVQLVGELIITNLKCVNLRLSKSKNQGFFVQMSNSHFERLINELWTRNTMVEYQIENKLMY